MVHEFRKDLKRGDKGEQLLLRVYKNLSLDSQEGHDLIDKTTGVTIELKTDYYFMNRTSNFFIEKFSDDNNYKLGGPWRSLKHNTDVFAYMFIKDKIIFLFSDIKALVDRAEEYLRVKEGLGQLGEIKKFIPNKGYNTIGYTIPREIFFDLYKEMKIGAEELSI